MSASREALASGAGAATPRESSPGDRQVAMGALLCLVLLAIGLRLVPILFVPSTDWPDEIFQSTEQAHRLIYGYGLVPWEFQLGMRSWLLPGAVAGLMELARLVGDGPDYYLPAIAIGLGLIASAPVVCCFLWCRRWFGLAGAVVAAATVAIAPELVFFGARALNEVVAAHLLVIAFYVIEPGFPVRSRWRLMVGGILLGAAFLLRIHLAPVVAVIALWSAGDAWRYRLPALVGGGLVALAFGAVLDWLTLGYPLASVWRNILYNVYQGVSSDFGVSPWNSYLRAELAVWLGAAPFLLLLVALGARRLPALLVAAFTVIVVHSSIAHKEYRFIYPAMVLAMVLAAVGLAQLTSWGEQWLVRRGVPKGIAAVVCAALLLGYWGTTAFGVWSGGALTDLRQRDHDNLLAVAFVARTMPMPCGIALYGDERWDRFGGYTYLHRPVPMFWPEDATALAASAGAFDTLLYQQAPPPELGFATLRCFGQTCLARRAGRCEARPMPAMPFPPQLGGMAPAPERFEAVPQRVRQNALASGLR